MFPLSRRRKSTSNGKCSPLRRPARRGVVTPKAVPTYFRTKRYLYTLATKRAYKTKTRDFYTYISTHACVRASLPPTVDTEVEKNHSRTPQVHSRDRDYQGLTQAHVRRQQKRNTFAPLDTALLLLPAPFTKQLPSPFKSLIYSARRPL